MTNRKLVLWGQRRDDIQLGSFEDRFRAAYLRMNPTMLHSSSVYRSMKDQRMLYERFRPKPKPWVVMVLDSMGREFDAVWA